MSFSPPEEMRMEGLRRSGVKELTEDREARSVCISLEEMTSYHRFTCCCQLLISKFCRDEPRCGKGKKPSNTLKHTKFH